MKAYHHPSMTKLFASGLAALIPASLPASDPGLPVTTKANNTIALDQPASWVEGAVPGSGDIALWDATVTGTSTSTMTTGQAWGGIRVTNPGGAVSINGPGLDLGGWDFYGRSIDLSAANANLTINAPLTISGVHEWNVGGGRALTVGNLTSYSGSLEKTGKGALSISGRLDITGPLTITDGTLRLAPGTPLGVSSITMGRSGDGFSGSPVLAISRPTNLPDILVDAGLGSATLELAGTAGTVGVNGIDLRLSPLTIRRTGPFMPQQPVILDTTGWGPSPGGITGGAEEGDDALIFGALVPANAPATVWQTGALWGNLFYGNVRFATGPWAIRSRFPSENAVIPDGSMVSIDAAARLTWEYRNGLYVETLDGLAGAGTMEVQDFGGTVFTIRADTSANDGKRVFSGTAGFGGTSLVFDGAGAQTLAGSGIRHSGAITIESGRLVLRDTSSVASASIALNGGTLEIERSAGTDWTFASPISGGAGDLVKSGAGTVRLDARAEHGGRTVVNGGTLALGAGGGLPHTSAVELNGGHFQVSALQDGFRTSVLVGTGWVTGPIFIDSRLAIGSSAGTIDFTDLTLMAGALAKFEVTGGGVAGDLGNVSGRLDLGGATLSLLQLGTFAPGQKFTLFAYALSNLTGAFADLPDGAEFTAADGEWIIRYGDTTPGVNGGTGERFITVTAIPEPAAHFMAVLAAALCATRRRRP